MLYRDAELDNAAAARVSTGVKTADVSVGALAAALRSVCADAQDKRRIVGGPTLAAPLGDLEAATGWLHDKPHPDTKTGEHVDQGVRAEKIDPAAEKITHTRLGYPQNLGRLGLLQPSGRDHLLELDHET